MDKISAIYSFLSLLFLFSSFLSVADLSATDYGIAVECSLSVCLSVNIVGTHLGVIGGNHEES